MDYNRGLIALRKQLPALCDKSPKARQRLLQGEVPAPHCVTALLENGGAWSKILLAYNASSRPVELQLEAGRWELLADERSSFWWQEHPAVQRARVQPMAAMILGQRKQE